MNRNEFKSVLIGWITSPFMIGTIVLSVVTYFWSVYIAFKESGLLAALISFCFPIISQLFWIIKLWDFDNKFVVCSLIWIGCSFITLIGVNISKSYENKM